MNWESDENTVFPPSQQQSASPDPAGDDKENKLLPLKLVVTSATLESEKYSDCPRPRVTEC